MQVFSCGRELFQLTRLMRGVTIEIIFSGAGYKFQLTRLMRGVTSRPAVIDIQRLYFNSHASCEA